MKTPRSNKELTILSNAAVRIAALLGGTVGIKQNTAAVITMDHEAVFGRAAVVGPPAVPAIDGALTEHATAKGQLDLARSVFRDRKVEATDYCGAAIDSLKRPLGRRWNARWAAAGFTDGSIAVTEVDPLPILVTVAAYLRKNPDKEKAADGLTAAATQAKIDGLETARAAVAAARVEEALARQNRDTALRALRHRLASLRDELSHLLSDDDARWYQFGFTRPADGHLPAPVTGVTLHPAGTGNVRVEWEHSAVAKNYRVRWRLNTPGSVPIVIGLFADLSTTLSSLPIGQSILIGVSARNDSGETAVTKVAIVVP